MKYLVLGGNGFIGSHLVAALCENGHSVRVFDRSTVSNDSRTKSAEYITGDFQNTFALAEALSGIDVVYHLISTTVPSTSNLDMVNDIQTNLVSTVRLLQTMIDVGVKKIVFLSSGGTVYGNPESNPIAESHALNPICSYGVTKIAIEKYLFLFKQLHKLEYNILRVSNPYGANQHHYGVQGVIQTFLLKALKGETITIWGDGAVERDYIYIDDLISVCVKSGLKMYNDIFNIGSGELVSISEIIHVIEKVTDRKLKIEKLPSRDFDVKSISLDCTKAKEKFSWSPSCDLESGILKNWEELLGNESSNS